MAVYDLTLSCCYDLVHKVHHMLAFSNTPLRERCPTIGILLVVRRYAFSARVPYWMMVWGPQTFNGHGVGGQDESMEANPK